jgi:hypothetical protein
MVDYINAFRLITILNGGNLNNFIMLMKEENAFEMDNYKIYFYKNEYCHKIKILDEKKYMMMKLKYGF